MASFCTGGRRLGGLLRDIAGGPRGGPSHFELAKVDAVCGRDKAITGQLRAGLAAAFAQGGTPILIDCCRMLGVLTLSAVLAAERIVIPISADRLPLQGGERRQGALRALERTIGRCFPRRVVVTRFDSRRRLSYEIYEAVSRRFGEAPCRSRIAENVSLAERPGRGLDIFGHAPERQGAKH